MQLEPPGEVNRLGTCSLFDCSRFWCVCREDRKCHDDPPFLLSCLNVENTLTSRRMWAALNQAAHRRSQRDSTSSTKLMTDFCFSPPFVIVSGRGWIYWPDKGQNLWHTGAFWEKRTQCCCHSCSHGCNKGNADSGHFWFLLTWGLQDRLTASLFGILTLSCSPELH